MTEETMFKQAYLLIYKTKNGDISSTFLYAPNAILAYIDVLNGDNVEEIIYIKSKYETD